MNRNIPVILVHKGNTFYLKPVLEHIRLFNPDTRICLLSDASTKGKYDFVEHYDIAQYMTDADEFAKVYVHLSTNPFGYELFCFQRWFIIREFIRSEKMSSFLCLDSDALLYCDVDKVFGQYTSFDFTVCKEMGPCFSLFNKPSIEKLCDYMTYLYTDSQSIKRVERFAEGVDEGGFCDMTVLAWYQKEVSDNVCDLVYPVENACFDGNISDPMGFEMKGRRKKIYWKDDLPYGKYLEDGSLVQFYGLHLQGGAKHEMYKYMLNGEGKHKIGFWDVLKWKLSPNRLKTRWRELKKMLSSPTMLRAIVTRKLKGLFQR